MLGSVGFGEIMLIALVALIVFGPHRLPEIARKLGELLAKARNATSELTSALDAEYGGAAAPIKDLKDEYDATKRQLQDSATAFGDLTAVEPIPPEKQADEEDAPGSAGSLPVTDAGNGAEVESAEKDDNPT
ncbi:MAG: twin-arginine translocase TatA/TatE family subunit [Acidimicrobiia bacterium]